MSMHDIERINDSTLDSLRKTIIIPERYQILTIGFVRRMVLFLK
ncbi:hypothetical protein [Thermincola potens]|uniref:Uncharacterized protein n=1 Tax=Thermincola potens (strain JR) TaxID=635013 RepID=D5X8H5_THEPJ|nr:hypothetical protein [Thermincola potens]ADG82851.1 hypothetical protein TherJR_2006 [Thermincola potens JR]